MNKPTLFISIFLLSFLCSPVLAQKTPERALFVSLIQDPPVFCGSSEILKLIEFAKSTHTHTLFVQVYRSNEAWFSTRVDASSQYDQCSKNFSQDPFQFLIKEAHRSKIEVHAWLNLLSLGNNKNAQLIKKYGTSVLTHNDQAKQTIEEYKIDGQYFLEPSDRRVRRELGEIVEDLVRNYPNLDGIQFDYIRYPDVHPAYGYTPDNIQRYKKKTGKTIVSEKDPLWRQWKRNQVTELLSQLVHKARKLNPKLRVSTTGCLPFSRAYEEAFQDWPTWVNKGLIDFVTVMNYPISLIEFRKNIQEARQRVTNFKKVNIAIGAYKFIDGTQGFSEEVQACQTDALGACVLFHYGNFLENSDLQKALN